MGLEQGLTRRHALLGIGVGLGAMSSLAAIAKPAGKIATSKILPVTQPVTQLPMRPVPRLRSGDVLGLVAPAGFVADRFGLDEIAATVRAMGLVPRFAPHVTSRFGYLAGEDQVRAADLMQMFADDDVRAVMAVRGGWGSPRMLPYLDFARLAAKPKLFAGFSDNTALGLALARYGIMSIHGPNAAASWPPATWASFRQLAFEGSTPTYRLSTYDGPNLGGRGNGLRTFRGGKATGRLLGGNLSVLSGLVGTPWLPDFDGAILFLEDTNESEYRIDRMMTQLALSGILNKVAGVVFGQCTRCVNPGSGFANFTVYEVLEQHLSRLGVPAFQGAMIGHIAAQVSVPMGALAQIDADTGDIQILESPVV